MASSERSSGGSRSPARSSSGSSIRTNRMAEESCRAAPTRGPFPDRRRARTASVRSRVAEARSGHRPSAALSSADSRSVTSSLTKADVSRYATLPLIRAQLRQRLRREGRTARRRRQAERVEKVEKIAGLLGGPALEDELVQDSWAKGHDPRDRVPVISDLDRLTRDHPPKDGARLLADLPYAHCVTHGVHRVAHTDGLVPPGRNPGAVTPRVIGPFRTHRPETHPRPGRGDGCPSRAARAAPPAWPRPHRGSGRGRPPPRRGRGRPPSPAGPPPRRRRGSPAP